VIRELLHRDFRPGDWVVFRKPKRSTAPGPRAQHVAPSRYGEEYAYDVEKYWVVEEVNGSRVVARTRRGKRHVLDCGDHRLRHARWWECLLLRRRFPAFDARDTAAPKQDQQVA
jgi:hypothetical protein